jgi:hypothetical protein
MSEVTLFVIAIAATLLSSLAVVLFLRTSLRRILVDLCGTAERADFWTAFSVIALVLVPLIAAMFAKPDASRGPVLAIAAQLRWALIGLVGAVSLLGAVISQFITEERAPGSGAPPC